MITLCSFLVKWAMAAVFAIIGYFSADAQDSLQNLPNIEGTRYKYYSFYSQSDSNIQVNAKKVNVRAVQINGGSPVTGHIITSTDNNGNANWANPNTLPITSSQVSTGLGYTPLSPTDTASLSNRINDKVPIGRTLTINGQTFDLSADRSWTTASGTVTSVAATAGTGINITGSPITTSGTLTITNTAPDQTVVLTAGSGISISGSYPSFTISRTTPIDSAKTRSLNTSFRVDLTRNATVFYSVYAQVSSALAGTNTATVTLETSPDNSTWTTRGVASISVAGVLSTNGGTTPISCYVPAGYYVRLSTAATGANAGSAVFTYISGQEKHE